MKKLIPLLILCTMSSALTLSPAMASDPHEEAPLTYSPKYKQFEPPHDKIPKYFSMDKVVVNFQGQGHAKFLAVDLKFMSYYPQVVETEMENLRPILVNDINRLLRQKTYTELSQPDGSEHLRGDILKVAREVLEKFKIYPDLLEDVYLDRFVMQ